MLMLVVKEVELGGRSGQVVRVPDVCCIWLVVITVHNETAFMSHKEHIST